MASMELGPKDHPYMVLKFWGPNSIIVVHMDPLCNVRPLYAILITAAPAPFSELSAMHSQVLMNGIRLEAREGFCL